MHPQKSLRKKEGVDMPENITPHSPTFERAASEVNDFLREKFPEGITELSEEELAEYSPIHLFSRGWVLGDGERNIYFKILLPFQFPYAVPRIAIEDASNKNYDFAKDWPHVEGQGILCLPALNPSVEHPAGLVNTLLHHAIKFVTDFKADETLAERDFRKEFISYWGRQKDSEARVWSLLDPESETQEVFIGPTKRGEYFVSPSKEEAISWLRNRHSTDQTPSMVTGLYIKLAQAPIPPFPNSIIEMEKFITTYAPADLEKFQAYLLKVNPYVIILSAPGESGRGIIAITSTRNPNAPDPMRGSFRSVRAMPTNIRLARMSGSSHFKRHQVARSDHWWIHGRGKDESQKALRSSSVAILGCGSLGSHVAVRLAQAGVGKIILIDPDDMETANVGRHALGVRDVGFKKTSALSKELRERFPHLKILELPFNWEIVFKNKPELFADTSLLISTMGEWRSEGPLNEWSITKKKFPILYGWMEPRAAVAHALLIKKEGGGCLRCIVNENGEMYEPDSAGWPLEHGLESEPACGSIFQPYGPVDLAFAEALVTELALATLLGKETKNTHAIHATSNEHLKALNGEWTKVHYKFRPKDFSGSFQYKKPLIPNPECQFCKK